MSMELVCVPDLFFGLGAVFLMMMILALCQGLLLSGFDLSTESLILAQDERWRRA